MIPSPHPCCPGCSAQRAAAPVDAVTAVGERASKGVTRQTEDGAAIARSVDRSADPRQAEAGGGHQAWDAVPGSQRIRLRNSEPPSISLTMAGESQASFSASVRNKIRQQYQYRCVICLAWIDTTRCAHLLDAATQGEHQVRSEVISSKF